MNDPLADFDWMKLQETYDARTQPCYEKKRNLLSQSVNNIRRFLPHTIERDLYHSMVGAVQRQSCNFTTINADFYTAIVFWKLYSTSLKVPHELMRNASLFNNVQKKLDKISRNFPDVLERDVDRIIELVHYFDEYVIYGMKSSTTLPMRTTFLHFLYPDVVPIFDRMVLQAVGFEKCAAKAATKDISSLRKYILHAWALVDRYRDIMPKGVRETPVRMLDMALWVHRGDAKR